MNTDIRKKVLELADSLQAVDLMAATAESCTGGLISAAFTDVAGSSQWFDRGFVTYNNTAKHEMLGVSSHILECYGAVSAECVSAMVKGALDHSKAQVAVAVSGIAGPGGEEPGKPVGTVFIGWGYKDEMAYVSRYCFAGDRAQVREQALSEAISGLIRLVKG